MTTPKEILLQQIIEVEDILRQHKALVNPSYKTIAEDQSLSVQELSKQFCESVYDAKDSSTVIQNLRLYISKAQYNVQDDLKVPNLLPDVDNEFKEGLLTRSNDIWLKWMNMDSFPRARLFYFRSKIERPEWFQDQVLQHTTWLPSQFVFILRKSLSSEQKRVIPSVFVITGTTKEYPLLEAHVSTILTNQHKSPQLPMFLIQYGWKDSSDTHWNLLMMLHIYLCLNQVGCPNPKTSTVDKQWIWKAVFFYFLWNKGLFDQNARSTIDYILFFLNKDKPKKEELSQLLDLYSQKIKKLF